MSQSTAYIMRLEALQEGERSHLRRLAGQPLDATLQGFDLFAGLWWPLRKANQAVPRREPSWLVAKLYGSFPIPYRREAREPIALPLLLGRRERDLDDCKSSQRFRDRFDALLCSPFASLEPHLRWALSEAAHALKADNAPGLDWAQLLDDVSAWDRGSEYRRKRDIREHWADQYLLDLEVAGN